MGRRCGTSGP
uniref:Uncharacterized protein n=1 Tax=Anguilla anguilla TaxID=7936 RepID=A0A0E9W1R1_ANGAN